MENFKFTSNFQDHEKTKTVLIGSNQTPLGLADGKKKWTITPRREKEEVELKQLALRRPIQKYNTYLCNVNVCKTNGKY